MNLTDFQKEELEALGDDPVKASLMMHRTNLDKTAKQALQQVDEQLPTMTPNETLKTLDTTLRHMHILDGRQQEQTQNNFFILPGELANNIQNKLDSELEQQLDNKAEVIDIKPIKEEELACNKKKQSKSK